MFRESGVDLDDEEINELVAEADENGDGVISFEGRRIMTKPVYTIYASKKVADQAARSHRLTSA